MKTIKKIESYLPVFPGFYGTIFEADETPFIDDNKTYDDYEWNNPGYEQSVARAAVGAIETALIDLGFPVKIEYQQLVSPRYYNFTNDSINVKYSIQTGFIHKLRTFLSENLTSFEVFIRERYTSCSGFISSYSNDATEWLTYVNLTDLQNSHYLGAFLEFVLAVSEYDSLQLYYDTVDRHGINIEGWLKEPETFNVEGIEYLGEYIDVYNSYLSNPIDNEWNTITFAEWLVLNGEPVKRPVFVNPNQLSLF